MTHRERFIFYLAFGLGSLLLSGLSFVLWMFNPFPFAFSSIATWLVQLLGRMSAASDFAVAIGTALLWPLTFAPVHWLTFRLLRWNGWSYLALLLLAGMLVAFSIQLYYSYPSLPSFPPVRRVSLSDSPISLKVGETHEFVTEKLRLTLLRVIEEKACANGEICDEQKSSAIEVSVQLADEEPSNFVFETLFSVAQVPAIEQGSFYYISWQSLTSVSPVEYTAKFDVYTYLVER